VTLIRKGHEVNVIENNSDIINQENNSVSDEMDFSDTDDVEENFSEE
jgi:hypothetical protein